MHELAPERVADRLQTLRYGRSLELRLSTGSTNDDAKRAAAQSAPDGHTIVADSQTAGRGSQGRAWSSPAGEDLYLSIVDRPRLGTAALPPLTLAVGLGIADAVDALLAVPPRARIKWPNDVWLDGRKCAGVLVEASTRGTRLDSVVIGVGLNVNRATFDDELTAHATSLRTAAGGTTAFDRAEVLSELLRRIELRVDELVTSGTASIVRAVETRLALLGEPASCGDVTGTVVGLCASGALRLRTASGVQEVFAGRLLPLRAP